MNGCRTQGEPISEACVARRSGESGSCPLGAYLGELLKCVVIGSPGPLENMERVVAVGDDVKLRTGAERVEDRLQELEIGETVPRPLQKKHRQLDCSQVLGAIGRGLTGRVERKAEECEASDAGKRLDGGSPRGHAASHRFAACNQWQVGCRCCCRHHR